MKKLILSLALIATTGLAFGQKKVVKSAEKGFKQGDVEAALTDVNAALQDPETKDDPEVMLLKAQIQTKMFGMDSTNTMSNLEIGQSAFETYNTAFEMGGADKTSGVGEVVYEQDMLGIPDNLRPYSIFTLKNTAFDKAIERYNSEDYELAYEFFDLAGKVDLADTTVHYNAGFLANDLGRTEDAKRHFGYLLDVEEYNKLNAYYFLVQIQSGEQDPEGAYATVMRGREDYPDDKSLAEYEIQLLLQLDKMDEAMASIKEALKNDPENVGILLRSGYLKEQAGDIQGALADYKKTVEIDPTYYEGNYYTGALMVDQSRKILAELNQLSDDEWEKRSESMGKEANKYYSDAVAYFERALEQKPEDTNTMIVLFQIHTRLDNEADAQKYNAKLVELLGENWMEN